MARSAEEVIKAQLGNLLMQLSIVQSQLEDALEKIKSLEQEKAESRQAQAAKPPKKVE